MKRAMVDTTHTPLSSRNYFIAATPTAARTPSFPSRRIYPYDYEKVGKQLSQSGDWPTS